MKACTTQDFEAHFYTAAAQQPAGSSIQDLSELLEPIRAQERVPSLAALVIRGTRVLAHGAAGVRRAGGADRITIDDKFHLGSDTKAMTATLIAVLVEKGRLSWSTTVGDVFGDSMPKMDAPWRAVTVEQLLRHRGGAPEQPDPGAFARLRQVFSERTLTLAERRLLVVEATVTRAPTAVPGTRFVYSNLGYVIAGAMAEKVTGRAYLDLMRDEIFAPLGMMSAGFGPPGAADRVDQPLGHRADGTPEPIADNPPFYDPSGRAHMTLGDWAKFASAHLRGDPRNPAHRAILLKPDTYERLHRPIDDYAMGWGISGACGTNAPGSACGTWPGYEGPILAHNGSNGMWVASIWLFPGIDLAVMAATNQGGSRIDHGDAAGLHDAPEHATGKAARMMFDRFK